MRVREARSDILSALTTKGTKVHEGILRMLPQIRTVMNRYFFAIVVFIGASFFPAMICFAQESSSHPAAKLTPTEGDYVSHNFHFKSGETLPELRLHYTTLGKPERDASGKVTNAVLLLHGTGGTGRQFLSPQFADVLFWAGRADRQQPLLHHSSRQRRSRKISKPSDGMHAHFPQYDYDDMVAAQHELLERGLGVNHLRLILGTSMGCMHSWVWGETYPDFMDALMPLACLPVQIAGRNRLWRKIVIDGIRQDPDWKNGDYTTEPRAALQIGTDFLLIAGSAPLLMQKNLAHARCGGQVPATIP